MEHTKSQEQLDLNKEGYLTNFDQWTQKVAIMITKKYDIELTDAHWQVIEFFQDKHRQDECLSIRGIKKSGVVNIKEFYKLFPNGPLKVSTKIAGIPKPKSCI